MVQKGTDKRKDDDLMKGFSNPFWTISVRAVNQNIQNSATCISKFKIQSFKLQTLKIVQHLSKRTKITTGSSPWRSMSRSSGWEEASSPNSSLSSLCSFQWARCEHQQRRGCSLLLLKGTSLKWCYSVENGTNTTFDFETTCQFFRVLTDNSDILCHRDSLPPPLNPSTKLNDPTSILCARVIHNNRFPINNTTNLTNSMEGQWTQKGDQPIMNPVIF